MWRFRNQFKFKRSKISIGYMEEWEVKTKE
jgi:hypothetical protein